MDTIPAELAEKIYLDYASLQKLEINCKIRNSPSILIFRKYQDSLTYLADHIKKSKRFCNNENIFMECFLYHLLHDMPYLELVDDD